MYFSLTGLAESSGVVWSTCTSEVLGVLVVGTSCTIKAGLTSAVIKSSRGWSRGYLKKENQHLYTLKVFILPWKNRVFYIFPREKLL